MVISELVRGLTTVGHNYHVRLGLRDEGGGGD
jgi:hypothetical protein